MGEYIGSLISLVTSSDLRYEGVLTEISLEESTITLKNVRAFGDEGRRPLAPQPPGDRVYELILFKANDIQSLTVITQQPNQSNQLGDPAIVSAQASQQPAGGYGGYNNGAPPPPQQPNYTQNAWGQPPAPASNNYLYGTNQWSVQPPAQAPAPPAPQQQHNRQNTPRNAPAPPPAPGGAPSVAPTVSIAPKQHPPAPRQEPPPPAKPSTWAQAAGGGRGGGGRGPAPNGAPGAGRGAPAGRGPGAPPGAGRGHAGAPPGQPRPAAAPGLPVPKEDFDFEAANTKFKKEDLAKEAEAGGADKEVYKKDDFFDMLSCEALGHQINAATGQVDWRSKMIEQKRLDIETFGGLGGVRHNNFGRGRGGGRGGGTPGQPGRGAPHHAGSGHPGGRGGPGGRGPGGGDRGGRGQGGGRGGDRGGRGGGGRGGGHRQ